MSELFDVIIGLAFIIGGILLLINSPLIFIGIVLFLILMRGG